MDLAGLTGETDRMLLRPYLPDDLDAFAEMHGREDVARYLPWETRDAEASRVALERHQELALDKDGDGITLAGFLKETGGEQAGGEQPRALVGEFVLFLRSIEHRGGEVGYVLHPAFQGRGLATEGARAMLSLGFETMRMHRIIARIDARNAPSAAVLARLGMRREAHLVRNELFKGDWSDEEDYAILDEEWSAARRAWPGSAVAWRTGPPDEEWSSSPTSSDISSNTMAPAAASDPAGESPPPKP